jgi:hypothetical protein
MKLKAVCLGIVGWLLLAMGTTVGAAAQTIRPVVVEYGSKAEGRVELVNDSLYPINVTVEPKSFSIETDGRMVFRALDAAIHLQLSSMSFRIPARQSYYLFYKATSDVLPAWFCIYANFTGFPRQDGLNLQIELPHTVYLLPKSRLQRSDIQLTTVSSDPAGHAIVEVRNDGSNVGRVRTVRLSYAAHTRAPALFPGFALLPGGTRLIELSWPPGLDPDQILIRFDHFSIEQSLQKRIADVPQ